jgi:recombination DNA repair RAD52 pathway protein
MREKKMSLSTEQVNELLKPIDPSRVSRDGKGFSHVEAWDIRRTMNRIFGFANWSARVDLMELVSEREVTQRNGKTGWNVVYRARCSLQLGEMFGEGATYTEWAAGDATNPTLADAHDQAIKTAESQAFKRCAVNLGDQFGMSLYRNGSTDATVGDVIGREHKDSGLVPDMIAALDECRSEGDLAVVAQNIAGLDIGSAEKDELRAAYLGAKARIDSI